MCFNLDLEKMKVRANGIEIEVEDTRSGFLIEGMGHDLAPGVQEYLLELLPPFAQK